VASRLQLWDNPVQSLIQPAICKKKKEKEKEKERKYQRFHQPKRKKEKKRKERTKPFACECAACLDVPLDGFLQRREWQGVRDLRRRHGVL